MRHWNVTPEEIGKHYPCQDHAAPGDELLLRAIDVDADPATTFRWLCQITVAPYSYDWIDNGGRRSPATLTPGADRLVDGQPVLEHLPAGRARRPPAHHGHHTAGRERLFGRVLATYLATERPGGSRIVVAFTVGADGRLQRLRRRALAWGDVVMVRKQLRTLKAYAEAGAPRVTRGVRTSRGARPATPRRPRPARPGAGGGTATPAAPARPAA